MITPELVILAAILLGMLCIGVFALAYVPYAIWKNRRRK
jgi:hypothetical protein